MADPEAFRSHPAIVGAFPPSSGLSGGQTKEAQIKVLRLRRGEPPHCSHVQRDGASIMA